MNAHFNVGFIHEQSFAEQLFNRGSLEEFHGKTVGDFIERAVDRFQKSLDGLNAAMEINDRLIEILRSNETRSEFASALERHLDTLKVNEMARFGNDSRELKTIEDIMVVLQSEFIALHEMTERTIEETRNLQPQIEAGLFVATVLQGNTPFNQVKISLGFGRGIVETLMSTSCHATILAVEDNFPLGFEFLLEPKCSNDGDVNGNQVLDFGDVLCASSIQQNDQRLPPECNVEGFDCELIAADVNCDSTVTFEDVLAIFFRFLTASPPEQCFAQSTPSRVSPHEGRYQLRLNRPSSRPLSKAVEGNYIEFSITVDNPGRPNAFGLKLEYPADQLEFIRVERTSLTTDWIQLAGRLDRPGVILVGGFNNEALSPVSSGELCRVVFAHKGEPTNLSDFKISNLVDGFRNVEMANIDPNDSVSEPKTFNLHQNFPNPFNPETRIRFEVPKLSGDKVLVQLSIYNIAGQLVRVLLDEERSSGPYEVQWDGRNDFGVPVPSGVYFYTLTAGDFKATKKMLEIK